MCLVPRFSAVNRVYVNKHTWVWYLRLTIQQWSVLVYVNKNYWFWWPNELGGFLQRWRYPNISCICKTRILVKLGQALLFLLRAGILSSFCKVVIDKVIDEKKNPNCCQKPIIAAIDSKHAFQCEAHCIVWHTFWGDAEVHWSDQPPSLYSVINIYEIDKETYLAVVWPIVMHQSVADYFA